MEQNQNMSRENAAPVKIKRGNEQQKINIVLGALEIPSYKDLDRREELVQWKGKKMKGTRMKRY